MSWFPISFFPPQWETQSGIPYSGAVLKAYAAGTSTVIPLATSYTGVTTAASLALNASGYPVYGGNVVIPHVQENYKLALYPTQAAADADSGALWTVDDIQIADETSTPFVEYFDGNGVDSTFTLSEDLGTDEKVLMVFADRKLPEYQTNGTFAADTNWTKGSGWTIGAGVATATGAISTDLTQNAALPLIQGMSYTIEFTITRSAGGVIPKLGGNSGTERTSSGTYRETIIAGSTQALTFSGNAFTGTVDTVTVKPTYAALRQILRPIDDYTLVGNQLSLAEIPPSGTKNVIVFAPSQLLGAATAAAAAAATSETNAANSATAADVSANAAQAIYDQIIASAFVLSGTSTSSLAIGTGSKAFTTQAGKQWILGQRLRAASDDGVKIMEGEVTAYSGTTLTLNVDYTEDSGTHADWNISVAGARGATGATGSTGATGASLGGFKNKLINGDLRLWDYASTYALTTTAAYGSANRWAAIMATSAAGILNRDTSVPADQGFIYSAKVGRNSGSSLTGAITLAQALESNNSVAIQGKQVTLSFWAKRGANFSSSGNFLSFYVLTGTGSNETVNNMIGGAWTGATSSINTAVALTTTWTRYTLTGTIPSTATQVGVEMLYNPTGTAGADDNFYITGMQLEIGSAATAFEDRGEALERMLAERYLPVFEGDTNGPIGAGINISTTVARIHWPFKVRALRAPTAIQSLTASNYTVYNNAATGLACTAVAFVNAGVQGMVVSATVASGLVQGDATIMFAANSSGRLLGLGAEI